LLRKIKRVLAILVISVLTLAALIYVGDYTVFRFRAATKRDPYGTVTVTHFYAVAQKSGKTEFIFDPPGPQTCVNAIFPHAGFLPCWYLARNPEQRTDI